MPAVRDRDGLDGGILGRARRAVVLPVVDETTRERVLANARRRAARTAGTHGRTNHLAVRRPLAIAAAVVLSLGLVAGVAFAAVLVGPTARKSLFSSAPAPVATRHAEGTVVAQVPTITAHGFASQKQAEDEWRAPTLRAAGVSATATTEVAQLNAEQAIAAAGKAEGINLVHPASGIAVTARKMRFSAAGVSSSVVPKNALVWIVTVDGLSLSQAGGPPTTGSAQPSPKPHTQLNIVIDANTGRFYQDYTYR
jgi:hypothetical protein